MTTRKIVQVTQKAHELQKQVLEIMYVLAVLYARAGMKHVAEGYARTCIQMLDILGTETMDDCATSLVSVEGIYLPELLHQGIVKTTMKNYGIEI